MCAMDCVMLLAASSLFRLSLALFPRGVCDVGRRLLLLALAVAHEKMDRKQERGQLLVEFHKVCNHLHRRVAQAVVGGVIPPNASPPALGSHAVCIRLRRRSAGNRCRLRCCWLRGGCGDSAGRVQLRPRLLCCGRALARVGPGREAEQLARESHCASPDFDRLWHVHPASVVVLVVSQAAADTAALLWWQRKRVWLLLRCRAGANQHVGGERGTRQLVLIDRSLHSGRRQAARRGKCALSSPPCAHRRPPAAGRIRIRIHHRAISTLCSLRHEATLLEH